MSEPGASTSPNAHVDIPRGSSDLQDQVLPSTVSGYVGDQVSDPSAEIDKHQQSHIPNEDQSSEEPTALSSSSISSFYGSNKRRIEYTPFDPESLRSETHKKRVPGKFIDRFWEPLDETTAEEFDKILDICLNKAIERYKVVGDLLAHTWTSDHETSFKRRLQTTKLPRRVSIHSTNPQNDENKYVLNHDILNRRKTFLETYLSAELKQLKDLTKTYNKIELNYKSDLEYLKEFNKTVEANESKMSQEVYTKKTTMNLKYSDTSNLDSDVTSSNVRFTPREDDEVNELLEKLDSGLKRVSGNSKDLIDFHERLQNFQDSLDML
ncbi:hypothetical protein CANTEDRAFT_101113 [Yamadazyma tenuis ATCC 10573]|uniref:Uncharacterized protein n=1 Tax=Candida tenuis (strain ATCC 10573 / BCRC 21748 / CBS 615 / JCM 9827 / NBRC 10315 / NRRL Y-1498 / VKM Y-70) TaxID=590646 RepID=G3AVZ2_CANTC|nr:uncharacterized protein CANTEDRAFT_101113 [Yamadazyma tenuis ATCC 10573]EGV66414.1 hypothetical protein CANTEDRAFT_101113 [Yamadazyma tenuis ATCC 10573]